MLLVRRHMVAIASKKVCGKRETHAQKERERARNECALDSRRLFAKTCAVVCRNAASRGGMNEVI